MNIDPAVLNKLIWTVSLTSAVIAAIVSAVFQLVNGWRERIAADKRHLRDLALKAAIVQWEHEVATTKERNERLTRTAGRKPVRLGEAHFDMILLKKLKMLEMFRKGHVSPKDIEKAIREMRATALTITESFRTMQAEEREQANADDN